MYKSIKICWAFTGPQVLWFKTLLRMNQSVYVKLFLEPPWYLEWKGKQFKWKKNSFDKKSNFWNFWKCYLCQKHIVFSSPQPKAHWWAYRIGLVGLRSASYIVVHISETTGPIKVKFRGASIGWGNKSLFKQFWSHDQDGHYVVKTLKNLLLQNQKADGLET